jgi:hypothetical protein
MLEWKTRIFTLLISTGALLGPLSDGTYNWNW